MIPLDSCHPAWIGAEQIIRLFLDLIALKCSEIPPSVPAA